MRPAVTAEIQRIENRETMPEPLAETPPRRGSTEIPDIRKGVRPVVERMYEKCMEWADRAQADESWPMFIGCIREARQSAELVAKLNGELQQGTPPPASNTYFILLPGGTMPKLPPVVDIEPAYEGSALESRQQPRAAIDTPMDVSTEGGL